MKTLFESNGKGAYLQVLPSGRLHLECRYGVYHAAGVILSVDEAFRLAAALDKWANEEWLRGDKWTEEELAAIRPSPTSRA